MGAYIAEFTNTDPTNYTSFGLYQTYNSYNSVGHATKPYLYYQKRAAFTLGSAPAATMTSRGGGRRQQVMMVQIPVRNRIADPMGSLNSTIWQRLMIKLKDPSDQVAIKKVINDFHDLEPGLEVRNYFESAA